ncbi:hypothetical protein Q8A73_020638 [Channa argus]|nr:hypothetical protein Q8A73_020638 [Channa argus]
MQTATSACPRTKFFCVPGILHLFPAALATNTPFPLQVQQPPAPRPKDSQCIFTLMCFLNSRREVHWIWGGWAKSEKSQMKRKVRLVSGGSSIKQLPPFPGKVTVTLSASQVKLMAVSLFFHSTPLVFTIQPGQRLYLLALDPATRIIGDQAIHHPRVVTMAASYSMRNLHRSISQDLRQRASLSSPVISGNANSVRRGKIMSLEKNWTDWCHQTPSSLRTPGASVASNQRPKTGVNTDGVIGGKARALSFRQTSAVELSVSLSSRTHSVTCYQCPFGNKTGTADAFSKTLKHEAADPLGSCTEEDVEVPELMSWTGCNKEHSGPSPTGPTPSFPPHVCLHMVGAFKIPITGMAVKLFFHNFPFASEPQSFEVKFRRVDGYLIDLCYLVDLNFTMDWTHGGDEEFYQRLQNQSVCHNFLFLSHLKCSPKTFRSVEQAITAVCVFPPCGMLRALTSEGVMEDCKLPPGYHISYPSLWKDHKPKCGEPWRRCSNISASDEVSFNASVTAPLHVTASQRPPRVVIKPQGFSEEVEVLLSPICKCSCQKDAVPHSPLCSHGNGTLERGACRNLATDICFYPADVQKKGRVGTFCECDQAESGEVVDLYPIRRHDSCVSGVCPCLPAFTGRVGECPLSLESCLSHDSQICAGRGDCHCGTCICHDSRFQGPSFELCPSCLRVCTLHRVFSLALNPNEWEARCDHVNLTLVGQAGVLATVPFCQGLHRCMEVDTVGCRVHFLLRTGQKDTISIRLALEREWPSGPNLILITAMLSASVVVLGVALLLLWKLLTSINDQREFASFQRELEKRHTNRLKSGVVQDENIPSLGTSHPFISIQHLAPTDGAAPSFFPYPKGLASAHARETAWEWLFV